MIRRRIKNTVILTAGIAAVLSFSTMDIQATEAYKDTAVAGIDAAIDNYILGIPVEDTGADATLNMESESAESPAAEGLEVSVPESTARYPEFENKLMANVTDYMNIRAEADGNSEAIGKLPKGAVAEILEQGEVWTKIQSGSVTGYVKNEFVVFGDDAGDFAEANCDKVATVTTTTLKVREESNAESTCLTLIPEGETYEVLSTEEGWTKLLISDEFSGFVSNEFIKIEYDLGTAISKEEEEAELARQAQAAQAARTANNAGQQSTQQTVPQDTGVVSGTREELVAYALQFVGNPYVYGGSSLTNGTDCSGFTMSVFAHFGYSLNRSSRDQIYNGTNIGIYEVQPGDLLFYNNGGTTIGHVAIYIGNGQIVHASTPKTGIIVSNAYYQTPCGATRILP